MSLKSYVLMSSLISMIFSGNLYSQYSDFLLSQENMYLLYLSSLNYSSPVNIKNQDLGFFNSTGDNFNIPDTNDLLRITKKSLFVYNNLPAKKINKGFGFSPEFKQVISLNYDAQQEFKKSKYFSYGILGGTIITTGLLVKDLISTINDVIELESGTLPDAGFKIGDILPILFSCGLTVYCSLESKNHFKRGVIIFNLKR